MDWLKRIFGFKKEKNFKYSISEKQLKIIEKNKKKTSKDINKKK